MDFHYDDDSKFYRIAYNYDEDEANIREPVARPNIRIMQFTTNTDEEGVTTIDQETGCKSPHGEPLKTLATFRRGKKGVLFGQNLVPRSGGTIRVGDEVAIRG